MADLKVLAAYDESAIATLPMEGWAQASATLQRAYDCFQNRGAWLAKHERINILERAARLVSERVEELAVQAVREGGKPYVDSKTEIERGINGIETAVRELHGLAGREIPMGLTARSAGRVAHTYWEPRGVVVSISAFNHPFNLIVHQVVPAVAVGAPVVIKPALTTPLSCKALVDILHEAGLPEGWCEMVLCDNETAEALITDRRTAFLSFIGTHRVGWQLRSKLAPGAACSLEHGGVAPAILDETADLDDAIPLLLKGGFYHAGQVCVSVQRIFVPEPMKDAFAGRFAAAASDLVVGDPTDPHPLPWQNERAHIRAGRQGVRPPGPPRSPSSNGRQRSIQAWVPPHSDRTEVNPRSRKSAAARSERPPPLPQAVIRNVARSSSAARAARASK